MTTPTFTPTDIVRCIDNRPPSDPLSTDKPPQLNTPYVVKYYYGYPEKLVMLENLNGQWDASRFEKWEEEG